MVINVVLGARAARAGWAVALLGLVPVWLVTAKSEALTWVELRGERGHTPGAVVDVAETFYAEEEGGDDRTWVAEYRYRVDGVDLRGSSYGPRISAGPVSIEYRRDTPQISRIRGMRRRPFGAQAGLLVIVPLAGLCVALFSAARAPRRLALLRLGVPVSGKVVTQKDSGSLAWLRIMTLTVSYSVPRKTDKTSAYRGAAGLEERTMSFDTTDADAPLPGAEILLLADPRRPDHVTALAALPGCLAIEPDGRVVTCASAAFSIGLAVAALLAQAGTAWLALAS